MDNIQQADIEELPRWLKSIVLPKIAKITKKSYENATFEITVPENCFFISAVYFVKIKFSDDESISMVIKKPVFQKNEIVEHHINEMFHNEVLFYEEVAPKSESYPRCFHAGEDPLDAKMLSIVTENVERMGFKMCPEVFDIPMKYIISGVREMAKFHAMGYALKTKKPDKFFDIVKKLQEVRYLPGEWNEPLINFISSRPIDYLRKKNYDPIFCDKMDKYLEHAFENVMLDAVKPCEPLAVLCHGDYTRNNIFYRETESKLDAILIDFAMMRYSSPAIDLSTFLYISCSTKDICENFHEIFTAYHNKLIDCLRENGINDVDCYSYDKLLADYKRRAMFGYLIGVFFIPLQRGLLTLDISIIGTDDCTEFYRSIKEAGGDELSKKFADLLINLRNTSCLNHVLSS